MAERFSDRHGYRGESQEISVREDAPERLRYAILLIAEDIGMTPKSMRSIICQVLLVPPDRNNWSDYPNVWEEVTGLMAERGGSGNLNSRDKWIFRATAA